MSRNLIAASTGLLALLCSTCNIQCFRVQISVQEIIVSPAGAWFNCSARNLDEKQSIDSIRWLKDGEEFYIYSAIDGRGSQKKMSGQGITAVDERSSNGSILIAQTNVNTTGCYKCVIKLTDGSSKEQEKRSTTIYLPLGRGFPAIEVSPKAPEDFNTYSTNVIVIASLGQTVRVSCISRPSNPAAKMGIKINGILTQNAEQTESQSKLFEPIDGTTYQNILYKSVMTAAFKVTPQMVSQKFIRVACSSMLTLPFTHGFLDQEDSDSIRIRVVQETKPLITHLEHREQREFMIFYSFFAVTGFLLLINFVVQRRYQKKEATNVRMANMKDDNSFNVSASYANPDSSVHRKSSIADVSLKLIYSNSLHPDHKESQLL